MTLHYELAGNGPRVLFFNGSGATLEGSASIISSLASFATVLAHDQRGLGKTGIVDGPYTMAQYARDAVDLLDEHAWEKCTVVGISFGGMVAQEFAVTFPSRVERLVLLCTSAGGEAGSSYPLHELRHLSPKTRAETLRLLYDTRFDDEYLAAHPFDAALARMLGDREYVDKPDQVVRGEELQLEARRHHDVASRLGKIACPTLVMAGRFDGIAPVPNSEQIALRIAGSDLRTYEGGHLFVAQDPAAMVDIADFVTTNRY